MTLNKTFRSISNKTQLTHSLTMSPLPFIGKYYGVSGLNAEGFWETLDKGGLETLQEAEEVYQASDPEKYSIVEIWKGGELIMTSDESSP